MSPCHAFQPLLTNNKVLEPNERFNVSLWYFNCLSATCLLTSVRRWVVRDWRYIAHPVMNFGRSQARDTVSSIDPSGLAFDLTRVRPSI